MSGFNYSKKDIYVSLIEFYPRFVDERTSFLSRSAIPILPIIDYTVFWFCLAYRSPLNFQK